MARLKKKKKSVLFRWGTGKMWFGGDKYDRATFGPKLRHLSFEALKAIKSGPFLP